MATLLLVGPARAQSPVAANWAKPTWVKVLWEKPGSEGCRFGTFPFTDANGDAYCRACIQEYTWVGSGDPEFCYKCLPGYVFGLFPDGYFCYSCPPGYTIGPVAGGVYQCNPPASSSPPPPVSPPPPGSLPPPSDPASPGDPSSGGRGGDGDSDDAGHGTRGSSSTGSVGGSSGSGSGGGSSPSTSAGGGGPSVGDLLNDFGADEKNAEVAGPRTVLVDEDILRDLEMEFIAAADRFDDCYADFTARLESLPGESSEVICADATLSAAYACAEGAYGEVDDAYMRAHALMRKRQPGTEWDEMTDENYDLYPEGVSAMDRISILLINSKFDQVAAAIERMREELATRAPACDPDDLMNAGTGTAGGWGAGGPGGSGAGSGAGEGGGPVSEGVHYRKIGEPTVRVDGPTQGTCPGYVPQGGEYMAFVRNDMPDFPDEIWPDTVVRGWFHGAMWSISGHRGNAEVICTIYFMSPGNVKQVNRMGGGGQDYEFDTRKVDFSQASGVITMVTGGKIDCREDGQIVIGPETITQAYQRVGE